MGKPKAEVDRQNCLACGGCISVCVPGAISMIAGKANVKKETCISCEICIKTCPVGAIHWEGKQ